MVWWFDGCFVGFGFVIRWNLGAFGFRADFGLGCFGDLVSLRFGYVFCLFEF